ncbi:FMN-binding protein [Clostridium swellfunianum]|uniref:FMN-binding protein n=1 Tax=Clostridium swellfunianum TaxID=1367462 RepID=UPI00202EF371|nr:FMN-binding protein [Clostridium swellfunianum]MCM0648114.1 FMN-binding protein [Clostridium swellfunianum]
MAFRKSRLVTGLIITIIAATITGCAPKQPVNNQNADKAETASKPTESSEGAAKNTKLEWSIQPKLGITKGDYYKIEERFRQGHLGTLEAVKNDGKIVLVEFNERTRPNYYHRYYQDVPKRMSEYNFTMGEKKGAAWIQGVLKAEKQMLEKQSLTTEVDTVSGASNSVKQSMVPLAQKLAPALEKASNEKYYSIAEKLDGGLTGLLKVVVKDKKIVSVRYDEIFADSPDEIKDPALKKYYRQSKYESVEYEEPSRIGFNVQMDELNKVAVQTQNMLDISKMPAIGSTGDYAASGYTTRNTAWDNYLSLAEKLLKEMKADGSL